MTRLSDQARDADERVVLDIVDDELGPLVAAGRATAELTLSDDVAVPSELDLHPANPRAAPLYLAFDAPRVLYVSLGRHGTQFELVERSDEGFEAALREILAAVVGGRYRERVELRPDGALKAAEAVLEVACGQPRMISFRALDVLGPARWHHVSYEPY